MDLSLRPGMTRRAAGRLVAALLGLPVAAASALAADEKFPSRPIELQVTFPAGGPTDTEARITARHAERALGTNIVVVNVAGAGGIVGWNKVPEMPKTGYALTTYNLPHIFAQPLVRDTLFDKSSFQPILHWGNDPTVFAVEASSPYRTIRDLIEDARAHPDTVTIGMAGLYLAHHLAVLLVEDAAGVRLKEIPFQGSAPSIAALLGRKTSAISDNLSDMIRQGNRVRMLAIATPERHPLAPNVPTFAEAGLPGIVMSSDRGVAAPKGTPPEVMRILIDGFWKAAQTQAYQDEMRRAGVDLALMRPPDIDRYWAATEARVVELIGKLGLARAR